MDRYEKMLDAITEEQLNLLKTKSIYLVGAGGLGGNVLEMLARIGVGKIRVIDSDMFEISNLNRQLLSTEQNLGVKKVIEAKQRIQLINSEVKVECIDENVTKENAEAVLHGADIVMDCVDNLKTRYIMQDICQKLNIPMIHGAVGAWQGQVSSIYPGDRTIDKIYGSNFTEEIASIGTTSFLPAVIASYQVSECIKVLLNIGEVLRHKVLYLDLLYNKNFVVDTDTFTEEA